jgi:2-keto-4-pentenoate hydratase/2-oxohepta-3-ene-1,7-dioic acid hydratase in catechol pathway
VAALRDGALVDLNQADAAVPSCIKALLAQGPAGLQRARAAMEKGASIAPETVRLVAPIPRPEKVICVGLNYADHAKETGTAAPPEPVIFSKFPTAVATHGDPIILPRLSKEVDYEAELVVVIGIGGRHIAAEKAREHIAGYCCGNDVSARDWQIRKPGGQWLLGKSFDTFAPFGPALVTADEVPDPNNLKIQLRLNDRVMQDSTTAQFIFPVEKLVAYVSGVSTLAPGDVIFTGTPGGVGFTRRPPVYLKPGDVVEVEIERLGILCNPVVAERP